MSAFLYPYAAGLASFLFGLTVAAGHGDLGLPGRGARSLAARCALRAAGDLLRPRREARPPSVERLDRSGLEGSCRP